MTNDFNNTEDGVPAPEGNQCSFAHSEDGVPCLDAGSSTPGGGARTSVIIVVC